MFTTVSASRNGFVIVDASLLRLTLGILESGQIRVAEMTARALANALLQPPGEDRWLQRRARNVRLRRIGSPTKPIIRSPCLQAMLLAANTTDPTGRPRRQLRTNI